MKKLLEKYIEEGWVISQRHPTLPLTIYNYSQATQFEKKWDDITLQCRGLVLDDEGNVVARPFKKFFNWEEIVYSVPEWQLSLPFEVYDKMDGSLGIVFTYNGELVYATRGSFASDQAICAMKIAEKYRFSLINDKEVYEATDYKYSGDSLTLLFEIIYPENRIVVDYMGKEELVLLGAIHTSSGEELAYENLEKIGEALGCPVVQKFEALNDFEEIKALNWENKEGMVIRFVNGFRMKIKFSDYVALHRILTNCSSYDIWENLKTFGELPKELFEKVPDEFFGWVREVRDSIVANFNFIEATARAEFSLIFEKLKSSENIDRDFALYIEKHRIKHLLFILKKMEIKQGRGVVKEIVDEVEVEREETDEELFAKQTALFEAAIWKMVKPEYSKPFADKG